LSQLKEIAYKKVIVTSRWRRVWWLWRVLFDKYWKSKMNKIWYKSQK